MRLLHWDVETFENVCVVGPRGRKPPARRSQSFLPGLTLSLPALLYWNGSQTYHTYLPLHWYVTGPASLARVCVLT